jgi:hypothetical protein
MTIDVLCETSKCDTVVLRPVQVRQDQSLLKEIEKPVISELIQQYSEMLKREQSRDIVVCGRSKGTKQLVVDIYKMTDFKSQKEFYDRIASEFSGSVQLRQYNQKSGKVICAHCYI